MNKDLLLPNGLPIYKAMQYRGTQEQCQIIKIIPEQHNVKKTVFNSDTNDWEDILITLPLMVTIKIRRITQGIAHSVIIENVLPYELIIWNESMNPHREVTYRTKKRQARTVVYNPNN